jgi:two-component system sensor histidine kinase MtrB
LLSFIAALTELGAELSQLSAAAWRRSLQLRVAVSTLALCAGVVLLLGLVLQTQIADQLVQGKVDAARLQTGASARLLTNELTGVNPDDSQDVLGNLNKALEKLSVVGLTDQTSVPNSGDFRAVLATSDSPGGVKAEVGDLTTIPVELRRAVRDGNLARQFDTVHGVAVVIYGQPIRTAGRDLQFYLIFPLFNEQRTLTLVQSTLLAVGLVLILLLAAVTSLVTRQVVRPVQQAADVAERFADGHLDERMPVKGDDEVARLAESYNEMAGSIQNQIRQLEEFGALQRRFTSDVSHELRTPLTTVRMAADVLHASREQLPPALRRSSELLVDELDRFEALLADLLEISRLDAGMAELGAERTDMRSVVLHAVEAVRGLAEESGTALELDVAPGVYAEIDPRRVERIVRNLVANAIDHGEGNPVQIRLGYDDRTVAVLVRDHGLGLRPGEAGLVFNRFWRADSSRARRSGGTGLGLSISLEDARLHNGWLQAWGEPGRGAAFRLTLPREVGVELEGSPLPLVPTDEPLEDVEPRPGAVDHSAGLELAQPEPLPARDGQKLVVQPAGWSGGAEAINGSAEPLDFDPSRHGVRPIDSDEETIQHDAAAPGQVSGPARSGEQE